MLEPVKTKKILLVEDEPELLNLYAKALKDNGYLLESTESGYNAANILETTEFQLLVTDLKVPGMSGIDLVKLTHQKYPKTKIICISAHADLLEKVAVQEMGSSGVLEKPFKTSTLLEVVETVLKQVSWADSDVSKYAGMTIGDFVSQEELKYPLFIKIDDGRFIQIAREGDFIPRDKLLELRTKNINEIWLTIEDFAKYKTDQTQIAKAVKTTKDNKIPPTLKIKMLKAASELAAEELRVLGVSEESTNQSIAIMKDSLDSLLLDDGTSPAKNILENSNNSLYSHAVTCSVVAGLCSKVYGWTSKKTIEILTQGAFLHDIGLYELPEDLQNKRYNDLNNENKKIYATHPTKGVEKLQNFPNIHPEVLKIVKQHHERPDGSGYPNGLNKSDITPMARLISFIDHYLDEWHRLSLATKKSPKAPEALIQSIIQKHPLYFDRLDVLAVQLAICEPDLNWARMSFQSASRK